MIRAIIVVAVFAACTTANTRTCPDDGRLCPDGHVCAAVFGPTDTDPTVPLCVLPVQLADCADAAVGAPCGEDGDRCYAGPDGLVCLPGGCGNGRIDAGDGETCDDGGVTPGDGCSAACKREACGNGSVDLGEQCDEGPYLSGDGCSSGCRVEAPRWSDITPAQLDARVKVAMTYGGDNTILMFGGLASNGLANDTWRWDGGQGAWRHLHPARSPSPRRGAALAYDPNTDRAILFGGHDAASDLDETWMFDGTVWTQLHPASAPSPRRIAGLTFDTARNRFVLFGGATGDVATLDTWEFDLTTVTWTELQPATTPQLDPPPRLVFDGTTSKRVLLGTSGNTFQTWEWTGSDWLQRAPATSPDPDIVFGAAVDPNPMRKQVVVFGGFRNGAGTYSNALWEWNDTTWVKRMPMSPIPTGRYDHGVAFDGFGVVAFGGLGINGILLADSWRWNGTNWQNFPQSTSGPSPRSHYGIAQDLARNRVYLFGGIGDGGSSDQTWIWDGFEWTVTDATFGGPSMRYAPAMTFDPDRGVAVLFGGTGPGGLPLADTWEFDPATTRWTSRTTPDELGARTDAALAYDPISHAVIMFGGATPQPTDETWAWNGTTWTKLAPATSPPARYGANLERDPIHDRLVLFGGNGQSEVLRDAWQWDGATWAQIPTTTGPEARTHAAFAFDAARGRMTLFGGVSGTPFGDVWELDGSTWTLVNALGTPFGLGELKMVFDPIRRGLVTFNARRAFPAKYEATIRLLRYANDQGLESCTIPDDDLDGDGKRGCDDPDCWGNCTHCPPNVSCMP